MSAEHLENWCLDDITLVNTYVAPKAHYPMRNRGRSHCGMLYTIQGNEIYHFFDGSITAEADTILFIPKGEQYRIDFEGETSIVTCVDFEITGNADFRPFLLKIGKSSSIKLLFSDAEKEWKRKRPGFTLSCKAAFYKVIAHIIREKSYYLNSKSYQKISDAVDYLHKHYLEKDFRLNILADMSHISQRYFEQLFFNEFKTTPKEYILSMKLSLAKELLANEKTAVTDIAHLLGYSDIYYFSKLFKTKTGYSPSEYKKQQLEKNDENTGIGGTAERN